MSNLGRREGKAKKSEYVKQENEREPRKKDLAVGVKKFNGCPTYLAVLHQYRVSKSSHFIQY